MKLCAPNYDKEDFVILHKTALERIQDIGKIQLLIFDVLNMDVFDDLSRKSNIWTKPEYDKMDEIRRNLMIIQDQLCRVLEILDNERD